MIESIQKLTPISWDDVTVRDVTGADIDPIIDYFYEKKRPLPFSHFDRSKRFDEGKFRDYLSGMVQTGDYSKSSFAVVVYKGSAIGCHTLTPILATHADFHAHFWEPEARGKKIGLISWYKASNHFFKRFGFERLYYKPPKDNPYSSKAIRALGLRQLADEVLTYPQLIPGIVADVYEITREEFYALK